VKIEVEDGSVRWEEEESWFQKFQPEDGVYLVAAMGSGVKNKQ
jgi:hypothetical protein